MTNTPDTANEFVPFAQRAIEDAGKREKGYSKEQVNLTLQEADRIIGEYGEKLNLAKERLAEAKTSYLELQAYSEQLEEKVNDTAESEETESLRHENQQLYAVIEELKSSLEEQKNQYDHQLEEVRNSVPEPPAPTYSDVITDEVRQQVLAEESHRILASAHRISQETISEAEKVAEKMKADAQEVNRSAVDDSRRIANQIEAAQTSLAQSLQDLNVTVNSLREMS